MSEGWLASRPLAGSVPSRAVPIPILAGPSCVLTISQPLCGIGASSQPLLPPYTPPNPLTCLVSLASLAAEPSSSCQTAALKVRPRALRWVCSYIAALPAESSPSLDFRLTRCSLARFSLQENTWSDG